MAQTLNQVPPGLEVWQVGGQWYLVRRVTEFDGKELFLHWKVNPEDVEALGIKKPDFKFDTAQVFKRTGSLGMGTSRELLNTTDDPVDQIVSDYETQVRVKPWLADPEILNLWIGASLEGREVSDAELQGTDWWRTHSDAERQWLTLNASDPATANRLVKDNRLQVAQMFRDAGVANASNALIGKIADQWTQGGWTEAYALNQIRILSDPQYGGNLDPLLKGMNTGLNTTRDREGEVQTLIREWLGPSAAKHWSAQAITNWAGRLRNDPDAKLQLEEQLRKHRLALFPEYKDPMLSYEDIAGPWRGVFTQEWGEVADETDPLFSKIVRMNDLAGAQQLLRQVGLKRNNQTVTRNLLSDITGAFGGQIRQADAAIL